MRPDKTLALTLATVFGAWLTPGYPPGASSARASDVMTAEDVLRTKLAVSVSVSPNGRLAAYNVRVPRLPSDEPGADYHELYVVSTRDGESRPFVTGKVVVNSPRFSPDGTRIAFLMKRGSEAKTQVWVIPVDGGEARRVTRSETNVTTFRWHPDGAQIAYVATTPPTPHETVLEEKGYEFVYFEENLTDRDLYLIAVDGAEDAPRQLTEGTSIWTFEFSPNGETIAVTATEKNLIDYRYVFRSILLVNVASGERTMLVENPGKLGNMAFNSDGSKLAFAAAFGRADHAVSQACVIPTSGGNPLNVTPQEFAGHINWVGWRGKDTVVYRAAEGVWFSLNVVRADGKQTRRILDPADALIVLEPPSFTDDFRTFVMVGSTPEDPSNVYVWSPGRTPRRLTDLNPWAADRELGGQEVIRYPARDGLDIEGLLVYPVGYQRGQRYPLIVVVHGGPESHYTNGWLTFYYRPAQVLAGEGYFVFHPNYRSSTGRGLAFTKDHLGDAAGKEFDDIADGIDFLVDSDLVDRDRVGLGGGSYGGYAAAWFATRYTQYVRAVVMFNGISDLISKRGTTNIPYEELYVHSGESLEKMWQNNLERSPVYYAEQSETAVLILGGAVDPRVHPSQDLEFYRRLKMNNHPAVRYVQYPGEGHGNSKQTGRADVLYRTLQWYDWYVMEARSFRGSMPALDISESYGLELDD